MTSRERTETVLAGGIPDRVPVDLHNFMMTAEASGMPFPEFFQDGEVMAEWQLRAWREFGHDVLLLENGTAALAEACGAQVEYMEGSAPVCHGPAIRSLDEIDKLKVPDPYTAHPLKENLKMTRIVAQEIGDKAFIIGRADQGPFSLAAMLLGMEEFLFQLAKTNQGGRRGRAADSDLEAKLHRLLEFALEVTTRYAYAQMDAGAHMTSIGESLSGPDVCSPKVYKQFEWAYAQKMVSRLKENGVRLAYHICGDATAIVPDMVETGATILELDYKVDMPRVKEATRGRATVLGPVDPSGVLALGTPDDVEIAARDAIEVLGAGGGLILGPGCALPPKTPPENIHALMEAAKKYGRY
jgi:MtaA/CmuA family methyltransferase